MLATETMKLQSIVPKDMIKMRAGLKKSRDIPFLARFERAFRRILVQAHFRLGIVPNNCHIYPLLAAEMPPATCANPLLLEWIKEIYDLARERNSKGVTT